MAFVHLETLKTIKRSKTAGRSQEIHRHATEDIIIIQNGKELKVNFYVNDLVT